MLDAFDFLERALVEEGSIAPERLEEARALSAEARCGIDEAIVALGLIDARQVALTKAQICESPYVDLSWFQINLENARLLPRTIAENGCVFPLFHCDPVVTLGMKDPLDLTVMDQVRQVLKCDVDAVQCETEALRELIARAYNLSSAAAIRDEAERPSIADDEETGPIAAAVNTILADAARLGASDVHLNPDQHELHVRFRIDGVLQKRQGPPLSMHPKLVQRLKVMAHLDVTQTRRPQDGKFRFQHGDRRIDVRLSIMPTVTGENVVMRLLAGQAAIRDFEQLGLAPTSIRALEEILRQPYGMLLVTGPTGSGKTTTLYTAISRMNRSDRNIITIEDPVEIRLPLVRQVQLNPEIGLTFAGALRSILRQDPDVVLVGEIRDEETAGIALQAALTGHFVLSTLHTNDAAGSVARLRDFGIPPFVINSAVLGVVAQRLVRRVCPECARPAEPSPATMATFGLANPDGLVEPKGCSSCLNTGYRGRIGVYEVIRFTPAFQDAVTRGAPTEELRRLAVADGTRLMWQDGLDKASAGLTTLAEIASTVSIVDGQRTASSRRCA